ncbi:FAD/NAD(P)-binding domain-containing protein [Aaosphaeria arxii CBS 175.79]|uniref:FAD/NAD(P)-binding domain-containing protein n=1 Tax=Aaosphaeria arxii CBS 175.79 TaxID=1450172 RepID=A0A6A5XPU6_9PLEO|nr:FAD/NAD(P)-binding domain-containing protein [Aaosphaeria arxii CBS 175.79]KAF2015295.1 FAD/NAD(P)-binding domain-containing protein [Aaosphaeria arxii CBS 175.79]
MMSSETKETDHSHVLAAKTRRLDIVIVGGSLGGLSTGIALRDLGHNVTILERNPTELLHNQGAGIVTGGDTLAFFKRYDRCGRQIAISSQRRQYLDKDGAMVHKEDMVQNMTSWDLVYYILRANFDGVRSEYCDVPAPKASHGKVKHLHGHRVTGLAERDDKVEVSFVTVEGKEGVISADFVVGADGPSSTVRSLFEPDVERTYAGYVALRGTVPEEDVSHQAREAFSERFTFFHAKGIQILAYLIPGQNGTMETGRRLINFVYYTNFPSKSLDEPSPDLAELMTDVDGQRHRITMPPGKTNPKAWEKQRQIAQEKLPPQFAEIVCATKKPFVQAITDVKSHRNEFLNGKVVLIGDALAGFRPHTVASTSQACFDAMILADMIGGKVSRKEWKRETMAYASVIQKRGVDMGRRSQFEDLPLSEHIQDRNLASRPREEEVWPEWALEDV